MGGPQHVGGGPWQLMLLDGVINSRLKPNWRGRKATF